MKLKNLILKINLNMDNFKSYLESCKNGTTHDINPEIFHEIDYSNKYYVNQGLLLACNLDNKNVVSYVFQELKVGYKNKINELLEDSPEEEKSKHAQNRMFNYVLEFFRENLADICKCSVDMVQIFTKELDNKIPNSTDFGNCLKASSEAGNLPLIKHLLSTKENSTFIEQWKYYNNYLDTKKEANEVIKYLLEKPELAQHIKALKLFQSAYENDNQYLVEYFIFDKNMHYSKKVKKTVESMTKGVCNVPQLFKNRDAIILEDKLQNYLEVKGKCSHKIKI